MGRTLQNIIFGYDSKIKEFMDDGLCAALTCKWLELCHAGEFMPFRKEVGKEGVRMAYGPNDTEEIEDIAMFWYLMRQVQINYAKQQLSRRGLIESHKLWVVGDIITGETANRPKLIRNILNSGDGYSYLGLSGKKGGHAIGLGVFPGLMRIYNAEYGEEAYISQVDFIEILEDLFEEEYPSSMYPSYEIYRVVGK